MGVIQPSKGENNSSSKKILYGVIILLAVLLILQTAGFLFYLHRKDRSENLSAHSSRLLSENAPQGKWHTPDFPAPRSRTPVSPAAWVTQDPFFDEGFTSMSRLHERMSRMFDAADGLFPSSSFMPAVSVDFEDHGDAYILKSDLPGLEKDEINISVNGNLLTLQGIKKSAAESEDHNGGFYTQERSYGSFSRTLPLPGPVDEARISASYQEGVLTVTLPKLKDAKANSKIPVQ